MSILGPQANSEWYPKQNDRFFLQNAMMTGNENVTYWILEYFWIIQGSL